jgi:hypothetical protein
MATTVILPEPFQESSPDAVITTRQVSSLKTTNFCEEKQKICLTGCEFCKNSCSCLSRRYLLTRVLRL